MKSITQLLCFQFFIILSGILQKDWNGVQEKEPLSLKTTIRGFTGVDVQRWKIYHRSGFNSFVLVSSYMNYQPLIHTYVVNDKLVINSFKSLHDDEITVEIHLPYLDFMVWLVPENYQRPGSSMEVLYPCRWVVRALLITMEMFSRWKQPCLVREIFPSQEVLRWVPCQWADPETFELTECHVKQSGYNQWFRYDWDDNTNSIGCYNIRQRYNSLSW